MSIHHGTIVTASAGRQIECDWTHEAACPGHTSAICTRWEPIDGIDLTVNVEKAGRMGVGPAVVLTDLPDPETDFSLPTSERTRWDDLDAEIVEGVIQVTTTAEYASASVRTLTPTKARDFAAWLIAAAHHIDTKES